MTIENSASRKTYELQKCFLEDIQALGPVCSIRLLQKEKKNFEKNYALLSIEEYY